MASDALHAYHDATDALSAIWVDYHVVFDLGMSSNRLRDQRSDIYKRWARLFQGDPKKIKVLFYKEIKKKSAIRRLKWAKYLDEVRFNTFSDVFYDKTRVCIEFARRKIYKMLR